jgi:ubiquinone/menaquinone biosynthesis C-methylase UbiE
VPVDHDELLARATHDRRLANILYHDAEATSYDDHWHLTFDAGTTGYARGRFTRANPDGDRRYERVLEIGCGTGFFGVSLTEAGIAANCVVTDISSGMVRRAVEHGSDKGLRLLPCVAEAEALPFADGSFDLVVGHAVLHHVPDVARGLREVLRVLAPGGRFVFAGEPTVVGDRIARRLSARTWSVTSAVMGLPVVRRWGRGEEVAPPPTGAHALEWLVDLHTFDPARLEQTARDAGAIDVRCRTEDFLAAWLLWSGMAAAYAVRGRAGSTWIGPLAALRGSVRRIDDALARVLPREVFYNALLTGVKPPLDSVELQSTDPVAGKD